MKIKLRPWIALVLLAAAPALRGRLGETTTEIERRLGPPAESKIEESPYGPLGSCTFKAFVKNGVRCDVYFLAGQSVAEFYQKETNGGFSEGEIKSLLDVNGGGSKWEETTRARLPRYWDRADHRAAASYNEANGREIARTRLVVKTSAFDAEMDRAEKAKEAKRIEGF